MKLTEFARDLSVRFDAKAVRLLSKLSVNERLVPLLGVAEVRDLVPCEKPAEPFAYHEISSVDEFGLGEPYWIDEANVERGSEEERILAKVDKGDIALPLAGSILIPKVRTSLGKFVLVREDDATYYTTAFFEARPKGISPELLYCILKHPAVLAQISWIQAVGKGYPTTSPFDLTRYVRIPASVTNVDEQWDGEIAQSLEQIFSSLLALRKERDIVDSAFAGVVPELSLRVPEKNFHCSSSAWEESFDIRMSVHFLRPSSISLRSHLGKLRTVKLLRLCTIPVSLGISPELTLDESDKYYLGPQAMTQERLNIEKLTLIPEWFYEANNDRFGTRYGDVFLRRSGASLGKVLYFDADLTCIFSDFTMRIRCHDPVLGKHVAYWLRSSVCQEVIRDIAMIGKGLQNIYPYQVELLPVPDPAHYGHIALIRLIDEEIARNEELRSRIKERITELEEKLTRHLGFEALEVLWR